MILCSTLCGSIQSNPSGYDPTHKAQGMLGKIDLELLHTFLSLGGADTPKIPIKLFPIFPFSILS